MAKSFKKSLQSNKIYFEMFSYVMVGGMSLVVSHQANQIGESQIALNQQQLELNKQSLSLQMAANLPVIDAQIKLLGTRSGRREEQLEIRAFKRPVFDLTATVVGAIKIEKRRRGMEPIHASEMFTSYQSTLEEVASIPIQAISGKLVNSSNDYQGLILTSRADANIEADVENALDSAYEDESVYFIVKAEKILRVTFVDNVGDQQESYFVFEPGGQGIPVRAPHIQKRFIELRQRYLNRQFLLVTEDRKSQIVEAWLENKSEPNIAPSGT